MSHPQLDNLVRIGQLKAEPAAQGELEGLLRSGVRRLADASRSELSLESRFALAYNAAHALALAALRFRGYRSHWHSGAPLGIDCRAAVMAPERGLREFCVNESCMVVLCSAFWATGTPVSY